MMGLGRWGGSEVRGGSEGGEGGGGSRERKGAWDKASPGMLFPSAVKHWGPTQCRTGRLENIFTAQMAHL